MALTLIIGNKRYSSWSLRGWLAARLTGQPIEEKMIWLDRPETRAQLLEASPSGRVPVLRHEGRTVWDSLAIGLYLDRHFPAAKLLPREADALAHALSVTAEMHSGFAALRNNMSMDLVARRPGVGRAPGVGEDIARIVALWTDCRQRFGAGGPWLFGATPTLADCAYAPVATRFRTYGVAVSGAAAAYRDTILAWPLFREWEAAAPAEPELPDH
ncbi:MAG TPA: glutathione S-transferase family protein [Kiloniellales bacterium]|nr:glutathione S-transferase family protein [Kiloniellales bacterium]